MKAFHNTTNIKGEELQEATSKALTQDQCVLAYFHNYDNLGATPERVLRHFKIMEKLGDNRWANVPITSIRRTFSTLAATEDYLGNEVTPKIRKTKVMIMGDFGRKVHIWKLIK